MECCMDTIAMTEIGSFQCGACLKLFASICKLHLHVIQHGSNGTYLFVQNTKTAYPRFDVVCQYTQTTFGEGGTKLTTGSKRKKDKIATRRSKRKYNKEAISDKTDVRNDFRETNEDVRDICHENGNLTQVRQVETSLNRPLTISNVEKHCVSINKNIVEEQKDLEVLPANNKIQEMKEDCHIMDGIKIKLNLNIKDQEKKDKKLHRKHKLPSEPERKRTKLICQICKTVFARQSHLKRHVRNQHKDVSHICTVCSIICSSLEELQSHQKSKHNCVIHQCELCNKVLSSRNMLEGHYLIHKGIKPFSCEKCEPKRYFTRKTQLNAHMQTHSEEKNLQCEFCGKPFGVRYLMMSHVKHCGGIKPHKCEFCTMSFVSNHGLQRHRRTHTGEKPYICEVCAFASTSPGCLSRHMRTHTGEKPFVCSYCSQEFAAPGALKRHVRVHTQEKPYQCGFCNKAFTQRWNLKTHERQHTGETPYQCKICGVGYKQNVLLKSHMKTHGNAFDMFEVKQQQQQQQNHQQEEQQQPQPEQQSSLSEHHQVEEDDGHYQPSQQIISLTSQQQQHHQQQQQQQQLTLSLALSLSQHSLITTNINVLKE